MSNIFQMQRLLPLLLLPTTALSLLSPPQRNQNQKSTTTISPPYTCDSILGNNLCDLKEEHKTVQVRGTTLHYWVYQVCLLISKFFMAAIYFDLGRLDC